MSDSKPIGISKPCIIFIINFYLKELNVLLACCLWRRRQQSVLSLSLFHITFSAIGIWYIAMVSYRGTDNDRAQNALLLTLLHWGVHGWICYVVIGLSIGVVCYRMGHPVTIRSVFYPIIGRFAFNRPHLSS